MVYSHPWWLCRLIDLSSHVTSRCAALASSTNIFVVPTAMRHVLVLPAMLLRLSMPKYFLDNKLIRFFIFIFAHCSACGFVNPAGLTKPHALQCAKMKMKNLMSLLSRKYLGIERRRSMAGSTRTCRIAVGTTKMFVEEASAAHREVTWLLRSINLHNHHGWE